MEYKIDYLFPFCCRYLHVYDGSEPWKYLIYFKIVSNVPHSNNFLFPLDKSNQDNLTIMNTVYV